MVINIRNIYITLSLLLHLFKQFRLWACLAFNSIVVRHYSVASAFILYCTLFLMPYILAFVCIHHFYSHPLTFYIQKGNAYIILFLKRIWNMRQTRAKRIPMPAKIEYVMVRARAVVTVVWMGTPSGVIPSEGRKRSTLLYNSITIWKG